MSFGGEIAFSRLRLETESGAHCGQNLSLGDEAGLAGLSLLFIFTDTSLRLRGVELYKE